MHLQNKLKHIHQFVLNNQKPSLKNNDLNETGNQHKNENKQQSPVKSQIDELYEQMDQYLQIQDLLQKQQHKNRNLLRREFQFKQSQTNLIDQINEIKASNRQLNFNITKLNQDLQQKTLQIMHLKNMTKAYQRATIDISDLQKYQKNNKSIHKNTFNNLSDSLLNQNFDQKKIHAFKQNLRNTSRKSKQLKQQALYAIYSSHKKRNIDSFTLLNTQRVKKQSTGHKNNNGKKTIEKNIKMIQGSQKKSTHLRRKSEEICKKTPSQKQGKYGKVTKRKNAQTKKDSHNHQCL